ncbi:replication protein A 70 kDa DNA-binding subunit A [Tanacetum coccineum]
MIATQCNQFARNGLVRKGSVVQLIDYICSNAQNRQFRALIVHRLNAIIIRISSISSFSIESVRVIVVLNMEIIIPECEIIGNPREFVPSDPVSNGVSQQTTMPSFNHGGEIRVTYFNVVVDLFYDVTEVGKVYMISKGSLKPAMKNFNHLNNEREIFLKSSSTIDPCPDEDASIPQQQFSFRPISEIETAENNSIIDVIGVVTKVDPSVPIQRKNGIETQKRTIKLNDQSGRSVELTLWGEFCNREGQQLQEMFNSGLSPVLAVKAGRINDFSGKSVGTVSSTQLFIDPDSSEAKNLRAWFDRGGKDLASQSISRDLPVGSKNEVRKTISQIKEEGLGRSDKPDWVTVKATVTFIKTDNFCYTACPLQIGDRQCSKKVTKSGDTWQCDRCNQEFEECDYRYLLQCQVQDHTGLTWVTAFQEAGVEILGCPAKELYMLKSQGQDDERFSNAVKSRLFAEVLLKLKIKEETYGEEQRVKITVVKVLSQILVQQHLDNHGSGYSRAVVTAFSLRTSAQRTVQQALTLEE